MPRKVIKTGDLGLHKIKNSFEKEIVEGKTKFHFGSLRSGQKLEYDGSIVVIGEVNSGAEVFATDNIVVVGTLRGIAHAGATGNTSVTITAMGITSPQIRIGNLVEELWEEMENERIVAKVEEDKIIIEKL